MKRIETDRLLLREFQPEDLEEFYNYAKKANVGPHAGWKPHESMEESKGIIDIFIKEKNVFAIVLKDTGKLIGSFGMHRDSTRESVENSKTIGYVLDETYWGQGFMLEATNAVLTYLFEDVKCQIVSVQHFPENKRSCRVIEKAGFNYEGLLRKSFRKYDGKLIDCCFYSMTRREYLVRKAEVLGVTLKLPETVSKEAYVDYLEEWKKTGEVFIPLSGDLQNKFYEEWLKLNIMCRTTAVTEGFVPNTCYFLVDKQGVVYGVVDIRHKLNEYLKICGGHIGYGVHPLFRKKGYGQILLALSLKKAAIMGIKKALLSCNESNKGSVGVIESNGGILDRIVVQDKGHYRKYWIETDERM